MKLSRIILGILAGAALFAGCAKEDPVSSSNGDILVDPSIVEVVGDGGEATLKVTAAEAWTAKSDSSWVTITPAKGAASADAVNVKVTVAKNEVEKARSAQITFTAGASKKIISVSQEAGGVVYGTLENPYTVEKIVALCNELADQEKSKKQVYIKGIISKVIEEYGTQYGNGTFEISDDGTANGAVFQVYRALYLDNVKYTDTSAQNIAVGDHVIIYGTYMNYKGTPETAQGEAYLYSLEKGTAPVLSAAETEVKVAADAKEAKFTIKPVNVSKWTAKTAETYDWITSITESGEGEAELTVALTANTTDAERVAKIVVSAEGAADLTLTLTQKAPEAVTTLYKISDFVAAEVNADKWYQISGIVSEIVNDTYGNVFITDGSDAEIYVYGITATEVAKNDKSFGSLEVKVGDWITINAKRGQYANASDARQKEQASGAYLVGHKKVVAATVKEFNAAATSKDQYYQLTGTVTSIVMDKNDATKVNAYGNLYIKDEAGDEAYIYGLVKYPLYYFDEKKEVVKFSNTKTFESLGISVGDKITVNGFRDQYNETIELVEAWLVNKEAGSTTVTIKDFAEAYVGILDIWEKTTGTIDMLKGEAYEGGEFNVENAHYVPSTTKITVGGVEYNTADMLEAAERSYMLVRGYDGNYTEAYGAGKHPALEGGAVAMSATPVPATHSYTWGASPFNETAGNGGHLVMGTKDSNVPCQVKVDILDNFAMRHTNWPLTKGAISNLCGYAKGQLEGYYGCFSAQRALITYAFFFKYMLDNKLDKADGLKDEIIRSELFGDETAEVPASMTITSADDWAVFVSKAAEYAATDVVTLAADITVTAPVDTLVCNFDGGNHTVTYNITAAEADTPKYDAGLFRYVKDVKVSNLKTAGTIAFAPAADSGTYHIGGVAGYATAAASFENCVNGVAITATTKVTHHMGGIVGHVNGGTKITGCQNTGKVEMNVEGSSNASQLGGIVGHIELSADVTSCTNDGAIVYTGLGTPRMGGIVGYVNWPDKVNFVGCTNNATITGTETAAAKSTSYSYAGGISGYYGTGDKTLEDGVTKVPYPGGGVVVYNNCVNNGTVTLDCGPETTKYRNRAAGIAALISAANGSFTFTNCVNNGDVSILRVTNGNGGHAGGIAGYCEGSTKAIFDSCTNNAAITNSTGNYANCSTAGILAGSANGENALSSEFKNVKLTEKSVITASVGGADVNMGIIAAAAYAFTSDLTGEVAPSKLVNGTTETEITAENYKSFLLSTAGTGSTDGVTFKGAAVVAGIKTAAELLAYLANPTEDQVLGTDIDMTGVTLVPATDFTFTLDGQNHAIKGLTGGQPLFLKNSGTIKNLVIDSSCALVPTSNEFAIVAKENAGTIDNVVNKGSITYSIEAAEDYILMAAIAAKTTGAIKNCVNEGAVTVTATGAIKGAGVAGIVAYQAAEVSGCVNKGNISLSAKNLAAKSTIYDATNVLPNVGGVSGMGGASGFALTSCDNYGKVSFALSAAETDLTANLNRNQIGGVVGGPVGPVTGCKNYGEVNVSVKHSTPGTDLEKEMIVNVGGIGGGDYLFTNTTDRYANTSYTNCVNEGNVTVDSDASMSNSAVGGIVGWPGQEKPITDIKTSGCTNKGTITGKGVMKCRLGGVQGGSGVLENCVNEGTIVLESGAAASAIGSIAGFHSQGHAITGCKAGGKVESKIAITGGVGGLIGNIGNVAHETGTGCEVNAELVLPEANAAITGLVVGVFNGTSKAITLGTEADPIKVSGSVNGTAITAENYASYIVGTKNAADNHVINAVFGGSASATTVAEVDVVTYATENSWDSTGATSYNITAGGVTMTASQNEGADLNGIYWGSDWRFYQARGGGMTVSVPEGHELVKAMFTYNVSKTGILLAPDGSQLASGSEIALSGTSAMFTVGNTGTATNGQVRFTKIVVEYK